MPESRQLGEDRVGLRRRASNRVDAEGRLEAIAVEPLGDLARERLGAAVARRSSPTSSGPGAWCRGLLRAQRSCSFAVMRRNEQGSRVSGERRRLDRLRRFWQVHPGAPNVLSTAGSFSPPVGRGSPRTGVEGYYIDFSAKADSTDWPPAWLPPPERRIHVATAQLGLGCIERYLAGDGDEWLATAITVADDLIADQAPDGGWPHCDRDAAHLLAARRPGSRRWRRARARACWSASHGQTGEERYAEAALARAGADAGADARRGACAPSSTAASFPRSTRPSPASYVLNGAIFALWGCRDVAVGARRRRRARALRRRASTTLAARPAPLRHRLLVALRPVPAPGAERRQRRLPPAPHDPARGDAAASARGPSSTATAERFARLRRPRACVAAGPSAEKVAFRLVVPRNATVRAPAALVAPARPRRAPGALLPRGQRRLAVAPRGHPRAAARPARPAGRARLPRASPSPTRSPEPADGKRLAVTFDDGYASMLTDALPILDELGAPGDRLRARPTSPARAADELARDRAVARDPAPRRARAARLGAARDADRASAGRSARTPAAIPRLTELDDERLCRGAARVAARARAPRSGVPCRSIAYPYGDVDERVIAATRDAGYVGGAALPQRFYRPAPLAWPRVGHLPRRHALRYRAKVSRTMRALRETRVWPMLGTGRPAPPPGAAMRRGLALAASGRGPSRDTAFESRAPVARALNRGPGR